MIKKVDYRIIPFDETIELLLDVAASMTGEKEKAMGAGIALMVSNRLYGLEEDNEPIEKDVMNELQNTYHLTSSEYFKLRKDVTERMFSVLNRLGYHLLYLSDNRTVLGYEVCKANSRS